MKEIIIESGSTKADIAVIDEDNTTLLRHQGLNPTTLKTLPISYELSQYLMKSDKVYFYGAGVSTSASEKKIISAFKHYNVGLDVYVHNDLLAACRATQSEETAIVCILGTGSNSCVFDGNCIIDHIPAMGFILGDEGGGTDIGKRLLSSYFNLSMPYKISKTFESSYNLNREYVLKNTYQNPASNRYIASHAAFLSSVKGKWKKQLLTNAFQSFIDIKVKPYKKHNKLPIYFVGSIAYHYRKQLIKVCKENGYNDVSIIHKPLQNLIDFHKRKRYA